MYNPKPILKKIFRLTECFWASFFLEFDWQGILISRNEEIIRFLQVTGYVVERQIRYEIPQYKVPCKRKVNTEKHVDKL